MSAHLNIVSVGMVTAVGLDAPSSCAAMRARLDGFQETRFVDGAGEWLVGAPVPLPRNWVGEHRLSHLASGAICEALNTVPEARGQMALILCLAEAEQPGRAYKDASVLARRIIEISDLDPSLKSLIVAHGRASAHVALDQARRMVARGEARFVMVAGVDSYLTSLAVDHYLGQKRLLTSSNPNGFIPGEAAAAVLCCGRAQEGGLGLYGLGLSRDPASIYQADSPPFRADGMTAAYRAALEETGITMDLLGYRISDLIGEHHWFKQTALAGIRLLRERHEFQDLWSPAESIGNVGAAVGPMMLGMAWMAMRKGYAAGNPVLVEASNDAGACGAALLGTRASS